MSTKVRPDIERLFSEGHPIDEAMSRAVREAIKRHKQAGQPMAIWRDGKTVWIDPKDLTVSATMSEETQA